MFKHIAVLSFFTLSLMCAGIESLTLGLKSTKYDYTEVGTDGTILDTERSSFSALRGLYLKADIGVDDSESHIEFLYSQTSGNTNYVGALLSGGGYGSYVSITTNKFLKGELSFIRPIESLGLSFIPTVGYHSWERTLSSSQNEIYAWKYYQLGLRGDIDIGSDRTITLQYSHQWAVDPIMHADVPSLGINDDFNLGSTESDFIQLSFRKPIKNNRKIEIKIEYESVDIGRSNIVKGFVEPSSYQKNISLYLGVIFSSWE